MLSKHIGTQHRPRPHPRKAAVILSLILTVLAAAHGALAGAALQRTLLKASDLPKGWGVVHGNYSITPVAADFFANYSVTYADKAGGQLIDKEQQSFSGTGHVTLFYLEFANPEQAQRVRQFVIDLLRTDPLAKGPAPERIVAVGPVVVIISSSDPTMTDLLARKLGAK